MDHPGGGMQIPAGQGNRDRAHAPARNMDGSRIVAAGHGFLCLAGDPLLFCQGKRQPGIFPVINGRAVHERHDRAFPQTAYLFALVDPGNIRRRCGLHYNRCLRLHRKRRGFASAQAHFFLYAKHKGHIVRQFLPQHLHKQGTACAIVQRPAADPPAGGIKRRHKPSRIDRTDRFLCFFAAGRANINKHLVHRHSLTPFLAFEQVDRLCPNHTHMTADLDTPAAQHPFVDAAHRRKPQQPFFGDVGNQKAHLVHMGAEHQPHRCGFPPLFIGQEIPQRVHAGFRRIRRDFF